METATEKIFRLLLVYPRRRWKQVELAGRAGCSKAFISKLTKRLVEDGILLRPSPRELVLVSATRLLSRWAAIRKLPKPVFVQTEMSKKGIEKKLKKESGYCLTLFSAAWHRIKFMRTDTIEMYVLRGKVKEFVRKLGRRSKNPTRVVLYPAGPGVFEEAEKVAGLNLVSLPQLYVDLIASGGSGFRVATELAKKYSLMV